MGFFGLNDVIKEAADAINGNSPVDGFFAIAFAGDDADEFAGGIEERAAGVAPVAGRIKLDVVVAALQRKLTSSP